MEKISPKLLCFAVFDGHGGSMVSDFASKTIIDHIKFWLLKEDDLGVDTTLREKVCK
jgi:serine/threonine protein phosphatase PrpC